MAKIYALLVGINEYKNEEIPPLKGCVNDILSYQEIFQKHYGANFVPEVRTDKEATKSNIVELFREHLVKQATEEDVALFVYAGHGARSRAAENFNEFYPDGWDEGIVCHDSRTEGNPYDLVDKEIALLIKELEQKKTHVAFILDSCHSGSSTRSLDVFEGALTRSLKDTGNRGGFLASTTPRDIGTYISSKSLDYDYAEETNKKNFSIPASKHVLLAACKRTQEAKESNGRGRFSVSLQEVLDKSAFDISYADLFGKVRNNMLMRPGQDPQFQTYGEFNSYTRFLGNDVKTSGNIKVFFHNGHKAWVIDQGAIKNIPTDATPTKIAILDKDEKEIGTAETTSVLLNESLINLSGDLAANQSTEYKARILSLPLPPTPVQVEWDDTGKAALEKALDNSHGIEFIAGSSSDATKIDYKILAKNDEIKIYRLSDGEFIQGVRGYSNARNLLDTIMREVVQYERTLALQNQAVQNSNTMDFIIEVPEGDHGNTRYETELNSSTLKNQVKFTDADGKTTTLDDNQIVLPYGAPDDNDDAEYDIKPKFIVKNNTEGSTAKELHALLLYFNKSYKIVHRANEVIPPGEEATLYNDASLFIDIGFNEDTVYYKLIVSPDPIDHQVIEKEGFKLGQYLPSTRGEREDKKTKKLENDWFTKTVEIKLVRQNKEIKASEQVKLPSMGIEIDPHPSLKARANVQSLSTGSRAIGSPEGFYLELEKHGISITGSSSSRSTDAAPQVLELDITEEADLKQTPLTMTMDVSLGDEETLLPMAFDGEHFILVGDATQEGSKTKISIRDAPETTVNRRSLGKALKLYFFKTVSGKNVNKLSYIDFSGEKPEYKTEGIQGKVKEASNILIVLHGIIGSTKSIVNQLPEIYGQEKLTKKGNLVLAYDYENLGTTVPVTAEALKKALMDLGLGSSDGKTVTMLAHSMGGLVTRWFVEQLDGKQMVDRVVLAGTPSGGSPFGNIDGFKKIFKALTELSMNFLPPAVPFVAGLLTKAMKKPASITTTLMDMSSSSDMLKELNSEKFADPGIPYIILAGDIDAYREASDKFVAKLIDKIGKNDVYDSMFGGPQHDIAVSLASIKSVNDSRTPAPEKHEIACHHMNYFSTDVGIGELKKITWMA